MTVPCICDHLLWDPPRPSHLLQVPWKCPIGTGQQLAVSGVQNMEGATEVVSTVQGIENGERGFLDIGKNLIGGGTGGYAVKV